MMTFCNLLLNKNAHLERGSSVNKVFLEKYDTTDEGT